MLFQLSPKFHLCSVLSGGPIVGQNEVRMHAVENSELAHGIGHGLIWPDNLQNFKRKGQKSEKRVQNMKRRTRQTGKREREGKSILWYSERIVYILLLILLWVEARFTVSVPFIFWIHTEMRVCAFTVLKNWQVNVCFILKLIVYMLMNQK